MFQSNSLLECEVPWKIDECCAVIDVLPVVPIVSGEQASEEFKSEDVIVSYKDIKLKNQLVGGQLIIMIHLPVTKIPTLLYLLTLMECMNTSFSLV